MVEIQSIADLAFKVFSFQIALKILVLTLFVTGGGGDKFVLP